MKWETKLKRILKGTKSDEAKRLQLFGLCMKIPAGSQAQEEVRKHINEHNAKCGIK